MIQTIIILIRSTIINTITITTILMIAETIIKIIMVTRSITKGDYIPPPWALSYDEVQLVTRCAEIKVIRGCNS